MTTQPPAPACGPRFPRIAAALAAITGLLQPAVLLGVRLLWGSAFLLSGLGKLRNLEKTTEFFAGLHIPAPGAQAAMVGGVELVGGAMLILGLGTRLAGLALAGAMVGAIHFAHNMALFTAADGETSVLFKDPGAVIGETPTSYLAIALVLVAFGPGPLSLDAMVQRFCGSKPGVPVQ